MQIRYYRLQVICTSVLHSALPMPVPCPCCSPRRKCRPHLGQVTKGKMYCLPSLRRSFAVPGRQGEDDLCGWAFVLPRVVVNKVIGKKEVGSGSSPHVCSALIVTGRNREVVGRAVHERDYRIYHWRCRMCAISRDGDWMMSDGSFVFLRCR